MNITQENPTQTIETIARTTPMVMAASATQATKVYGHGDTRVVALDAVDIAFETGKFTAIMGPSGSGKSTLMHCMAGLDRLSSGNVYVGDTDITAASEKVLTNLRRDRLGFIFQAFNLIPVNGPVIAPTSSPVASSSGLPSRAPSPGGPS